MILKELTISYKNRNFTIAYFLRPGKKETLLYLHGGACSRKLCVLQASCWGIFENLQKNICESSKGIEKLIEYRFLKMG